MLFFVINKFYYIGDNNIGGASVRRIMYNWWESSMVIPSKEPLVSLGAEVVRLGLSVGKQEFEPQCESVKLLSLVKLYINRC